MALICDTGVLLAAYDRSDPEHEPCAALLKHAREPRLVPILVMVELEYHLRQIESGFARILDDVGRGAVRVADLPLPLLLRAGQLIERYRDLKLGLVDASVIATAEHLGEPKVATLDRRHFSVVRPAHVAALTLMPVRGTV